MPRRFLALALTLATLEGAALAKPCPNIMLVIDRSLSMNSDPQGNEPGTDAFKGPSKWELLQQVVADIIKQYGDFVPFGTILYSGVLGGPDANCPDHADVAAPVGHDSAGAILQSIRTATPSGLTATNGAIRKARMDPGLADPKKGNFIVLITDGNPNCGTADSLSFMGNQDISTAPGGTLDELTLAFKQKPSIKTYVIGFDGDSSSNGVKPANLNFMAHYGAGGGMSQCGGMGQPNCYYTAGVNFADFKAAFDKIVTDAGASEFGEMLCDDSCYSVGCPAGQICTTSEVNQVPHCEPDQCMGAKCDGDTFCRSGKCVKACDRRCDPGTICVDGTCAEDLCFNKNCAAGQVCNPKNGTCIDFPCPNCNTRGSYCDVGSGKCLTDGCKTKTINCPSEDYECVNFSNCQNKGSSGSCSVTDAGAKRFDPRNPLAGTLLLVALGMLLRRRSHAR